MLAFHAILAVQAGGYVSPFKAIPVLILLALWARLLTWADKDAEAAHLPRIPLNLSNLGGMALGFALFFFLPTFVLAFMVLMLVFVAESGVYLGLRQKEVGLKDLNRQFMEFKEGLFKPKEKGDEIKLEAGRVTLIGKDGKALPVPEADSPDRAAFDLVQSILTDPIQRGAEQIDFAPEGEQYVLRYSVDNVSHKGAVSERTLANAAIAYIKWAGGLNVEDKRKPQTANIKSMLNKDRHELRIQTAGTTAGEALRVTVDPRGRHMFKLADLGVSAAQKQLIQDTIHAKEGGLIILSAPKGHGLTSLFYTMMRSHDAFLEHAQTVEREQQQDLEGITQNALAPTASTSDEYDKIDWVCGQDPDVLGVSSIENPKSAEHLAKYAKSGKHVYVCLRANSTFEAVEKWKKLSGNSKAAFESVKLVINGRVMRRLCEACKEGFAPDPTTLKKLNLSPDNVSTLYKAREQPLRDGKGQAVECTFCHDLRYKGRIGVFETLVADDELRQVIESGKPLAQIFRKQKGRYLQEEALALVEQGETSVPEVLRVLKPAAEGERPAGSASGGGAAVAARPAPTNPAAPGAKAAVKTRK